MVLAALMLPAGWLAAARPAMAQTRDVERVYIVVPGMYDDGAGLLTLVTPWAYGAAAGNPNPRVIRTGTAAPSAAEVQATLNQGVRVFAVDMENGAFRRRR